jgi:tRNA G18 (ribose-2'-O)-methylase SpoU
VITKNQIKFIKSLSLKKNRIKEQLFIAEGEKVVSELLRSDFEIKNIYATKEWKVSNDNITQISINYQKSLNQHLILIEGIEVYFPYKPYECQVTYMMKCKLYKK